MNFAKFVVQYIRSSNGVHSQAKPPYPTRRFENLQNKSSSGELRKDNSTYKTKKGKGKSHIKNEIHTVNLKYFYQIQKRNQLFGVVYTYLKSVLRVESTGSTRRACEHSESAGATEGWGDGLRIPWRHAWLGRRYAQTDRQNRRRSWR